MRTGDYGSLIEIICTVKQRRNFVVFCRVISTFIPGGIQCTERKMAIGNG
jgi:hypothetical protein